MPSVGLSTIVVYDAHQRHQLHQITTSVEKESQAESESTLWISIDLQGAAQISHFNSVLVRTSYCGYRMPLQASRALSIDLFFAKWFPCFGTVGQ